MLVDGETGEGRPWLHPYMLTLLYVLPVYPMYHPRMLLNDQSLLKRWFSENKANIKNEKRSLLKCCSGNILLFSPDL